MGRLGKIETFGSLLAPVSPALVDVQEGRVRDGHHRRVRRLRLGGMCPYSAIHVRGVVTIGGSAKEHWSLTQATVALSSGEAEYLALVKASMSTPALHDPSRIDRAWENSGTQRREFCGSSRPSGNAGSLCAGWRARTTPRHSHEADVVGRDAGKAQRYWCHCSCSRRA